MAGTTAMHHCAVIAACHSPHAGLRVHLRQPNAEQGHQFFEHDRLRNIVRSAGVDAFLAIALHRLGSQSDDRQTSEIRASARMARIVSYPSISGIMMSISTKSTSGFVSAYRSPLSRFRREEQSICGAPARWSGQKCSGRRHRRSEPCRLPATRLSSVPPRMIRFCSSVRSSSRLFRNTDVSSSSRSWCRYRLNDGRTRRRAAVQSLLRDPDRRTRTR